MFQIKSSSWRWRVVLCELPEGSPPALTHQKQEMQCCSDSSLTKNVKKKQTLDCKILYYIGTKSSSTAYSQSSWLLHWMQSMMGNSFLLEESVQVYIFNVRLHVEILCCSFLPLPLSCLPSLSLNTGPISEIVAPISHLHTKAWDNRLHNHSSLISDWNVCVCLDAANFQDIAHRHRWKLRTQGQVRWLKM